MEDDNSGTKQDILFEAAISSAPHLGTIFFIWGNISKSFTMRIHKKGIDAMAVNESNTLNIELNIPEEKLLYYDFNGEGDDGEQVIASFLSDELQAALPPSGKFVTTFVMFKEDYRRMYYIRSLSSRRQDMSNMSTITPYLRPNVIYTVCPIPEYPVTKILVSELVGAITSIVKEGTPTTVFTMFPEGMRMHGVHSSGVEKGVSIFGNIEKTFKNQQDGDNEVAKRISDRLRSIKTVRKSEDGVNDQKFIIKQNKGLNQIVIQTDCIRSLARLRTACPEGSIMSIYYAPGSPVILVCDAGVFGTLTFRIRN